MRVLHCCGVSTRMAEVEVVLVVVGYIPPVDTTLALHQPTSLHAGSGTTAGKLYTTSNNIELSL